MKGYQSRYGYAEGKFPNFERLAAHINSKDDPAKYAKLLLSLCEQRIHACPAGAKQKEVSA